ncbi:MAG: class I SAM-dependent methyltransferase [Polyangiaceae bacterium]|jgi:SAM-dependent methyltransferase|nr:class I SAM-dependent methyltransferase [Polyangiaceae bacterium]
MISGRYVPPSRSIPISVDLLSPARARGVLEQGALAHYADPTYYTKCYASRRDDVAFYLDTAVRLGVRNVLEYGCGNGRIAIPLARNGASVVGVDLSSPMLDDLRAKLEREPMDVRQRVRLVHGDMRDVRLGTRFELVLCTFNTFLHMYNREDVERFLAGVRSHLAPSAPFVFDTSLPLPQELARDPNRAYRVPKLKLPATGEVVRYAEFFDYDPVTQVLYVTMRFEPVDAPERAWTTLLTHRQFFPHEIEALLHYNGFVLEKVLADFTDGAPDGSTDSLVWVARARR